MDFLSVWSRRFAGAVVPDEAQMAPLVAQAFVAGGPARADLFAQSKGPGVGGFGTMSAVMVFPNLLNSLAIAAPLVTAMLAAAPHINDFLDIVKGGLDIREAVDRKRHAVSLPDDPYAPLKQTLAVLDRELSSVPISTDERDLICYRVLHALLEDPQESRRAVTILGEAGGKT